MKQMSFLWLGIVLMPTAVYADDKKPAELTDPIEILKKADAAAKAVKAVKYKVDFDTTGMMVSLMPKMTVSVVASGFAQGAPKKFTAEAEVTVPGATEPMRISCGTDYDTFYVVHHPTRKAYEDIDPAVLGATGRLLRNAMMIEFLHDRPFDDEINAKSKELKGSKIVGGVDCYEIHVVYGAERAPEVTWYFSKEDFLPRGRVDHYPPRRGETGTFQRTITDLVVDPKFEKDAFKLKLPKGYTKTDDFAPNFFGAPR